ncbi:hypothetical protein EVAR_96510_1 [Eumeta japonica]|uniref:Uncharacterized protein n=1 Tax=Eumeta variegata TaxID=151549 RepID=A0A4C1WDR7_EUMVA|nr:hypothetical protein EVAR_96510_1 [Eumeta japonica]
MPKSCFDIWKGKPAPSFIGPFTILLVTLFLSKRPATLLDLRVSMSGGDHPLLTVVCGRSLIYSDASADVVEERSLSAL